MRKVKGMILVQDAIRRNKIYRCTFIDDMILSPSRKINKWEVNTMDYEQATGQPRGTKSVELKNGIRGMKDHLRLFNVLPEPYTAEEYCAALDDFNRRYDAGERTM